MKKTKFISAILAAAQLFTLSFMPADAETSDVDYSVVFSNDGISEDWENMNTAATEIQQIEEGENKIVRLKTKSYTWPTNVSRMRIDLGEKKVKFEEGKVITIETKIRPKTLNGANARLSIKANTDYKCSYRGNTGSELDFGIGANRLVLAGLAWDKASAYTAFLMPTGTTFAGTMQTNFAWQKMNIDNPSSHLYEDLLDGNTWVTIKIKLDKLANKANYVVSWNGKEKTFATSDLGVYTTHDYLETLDIDNTVSQLDYIDVDYIKVSTYLDNAEAELLGAEVVEGENEIRIDDSFKVKFNLPIDESSFTSDSVKLINKDTEEEIELAANSYDEENLILTITPAEDLPHGNYVIKLSGDIKTTDIYSDLSKKWIPLKAADFSFRYFATNPPEAADVEILGTSEVGETIIGKYTYNSDDEIAEAGAGSEYQWYISDSENGKYTAIDGKTQKELVIEEEYSNKFIKFGVTPVDETGLKGVEVLSDAFVTPSKPYAENVLVSGNAVVGQVLVASYSFVDENDDKEGTTLYQWYVSDSAASGFEAIDGENEKTLKLDENFAGKYIKVEVTPVSQNIPYEGIAVMSEAKGPVAASLMEGTNLVGENADLEKGDLTNWMVANASDRPNEIRLVSKEEGASNVYSGNYSLEVKSLKGIWGYNGVQMEANTAYLVSMMVKSPSGSSTAYLYSWPVNSTGGTRSQDFDTLNYSAAGKAGTGIVAGTGNNLGADWSRVTDVMVAYNKFVPNVALVSWSQSNTILVDDLYVGKLAIASIDVDLPEEIDIPASGEKEISLDKIKVKNQIGTTYGFEGAPVRFELPAGVSGSRIDTDEDGKQSLIITNYASVGTLNIKVICDPYGDTGSVKYAGVEPFETVASIELNGKGSPIPQIITSDLIGTVKSGDALKLNYTFYQLYGDADKSEISWWYSSDKDGEYTEIEDAKGKIYIVPAEKADGYFKVKILPKTATDEGVAVWTNVVGVAEAPTATDIKISGSPFVGETVTGTYKYSDFNRDEEGETTFKWLRATSPNGEYSEIPGANGLTYVLTEADKDMYIKLEVTPVSKVAPEVGEAVTSDAFAGPKAPEAKNLKIEKNGKGYAGTYEYYQANGAAEGKTQYRWLVDGKEVSKEISYVPDFTGTKKLTFEVTPVSSKEPSVGEAVSVSITVTINKKSSGGGGGSSGGGSPSMIGAASGNGTVTQPIVPSIVVPPVAPDTTIAGAMTDIKEHWGYEAIRWALNENIMEKKTNDTFEPDSFATRQEIIMHMSKILGWEATESQGIFGDVEGEFANILQTFVDKGVISVDVNFRPGDNLTRQELAKILAISLGLTSEKTDTTSFADNADMGEWAIAYINATTEAGLLKGVGDNYFSPKGNVTRAQLATLLQRVSQSLAE